MAIDDCVTRGLAGVGVDVGKGSDDVRYRGAGWDRFAPVEGVSECHLCVSSCGEGSEWEGEAKVWNICATG